VPVDSESAGIIEKRNEAEFQAIQKQAHMAMYHEWQKLEQMEDVSPSTDEFKLLALQKAWTEKRDSAFLEYSIQKQREIREAERNFSQKQVGNISASTYRRRRCSFLCQVGMPQVLGASKF